MPDTGSSVVETPQTEEQIQQAAAKTELDTMMKINLNGSLVPAETSNQKNAGESNNQSDGQASSDEVIFDEEKYVKDTWGFENVELGKKEIEELRAFKTKPPAVEPIKFDNEDSEKLFKAFTKGDKKEIYSLLEKHEKLDTITKSEVTKDNAADIIKLGMQLGNSRLTKDDIDFQYKELYGLPKEPVQKATEEEDDFKERHEEWKERSANVEMKRIVAAKMAMPELEKHKTEIKFPEITDTVDEGYLQYKKALEELPQVAEAMKEIYKPFTSKSLELKIPFTDETNKIGFEYQYEPDAESFNRSKELAMDSSKFMDNFKTSDGKFDNLKYLQAIDFALNKDKYILEAMKQTKNATIKAFLPDNSGSGTQRQFPQGQQNQSELATMMKLAGVA